MSEQDQQIGELIGRLDTFMDSEKENRDRTDAALKALANDMATSLAELTKSIGAVDSKAESAHGRINKIYWGGGIIGGTITAIGAGVGWLFNHGSQAVEVGKEIINHK